MTTITNTYDPLFPFTDKEIRFLYTDACMLEVSKDDINLSDFVAPKTLILFEERKDKGYAPMTLKYILGRSFYLITGKLLA